LLDFLTSFHDAQCWAERPPDKPAFVAPESAKLQALAHLNRTLVGRAADATTTTATIDHDGTLIESHKRDARVAYEGTRGYQPLVALWAEEQLIVADEFRDGNVAAGEDPLRSARRAFDTLPPTVTTRYFRGDSACHENELLDWLKHPEREKEPGGRIGFAISAVMSAPLGEAIRKVGEAQWKTFGDKEQDGTLRQWAEVDFVPGDKSEHKESKPLRYVGLRLLKPQGVLFKDGSDRHFHAVITNEPTEGDRLLEWHREKAGTVEHAHDEVKNELAGKHVPSQRFGVNSAWFKIALLTYNIISAIKGLCLEGEERSARMKRFRLLLIHVAERMNRNNCVMGLRVCHNAEALKRMQAVWRVFELPTQATSAKALGRRGS
jgi:hypothetical protein